jgi:hypothetical protein
MSTSQNLGDAVDKVAAYLGNDPLTAPEKMVFADFMLSEFKTVRADELLDAVKGVISGRIQTPTDVTRIKKLSSGWWGSVLRGYKVYRSEEARRNPAIEMDDRKRLEINSGGVDGKDAEYYRLLKKWYFEHGQIPPYGWAWKQARNHAKTLPNYAIKKSDEALIMERARIYCSKKQGTKGLTFSEKSKVTENDIDREVLRLHFERMTKTG